MFAVACRVRLKVIVIGVVGVIEGSGLNLGHGSWRSGGLGSDMNRIVHERGGGVWKSAEKFRNRSYLRKDHCLQ